MRQLLPLGVPVPPQWLEKLARMYNVLLAVNFLAISFVEIKAYGGRYLPLEVPRCAVPKSFALNHRPGLVEVIPAAV